MWYVVTLGPWWRSQRWEIEWPTTPFIKMHKFFSHNIQTPFFMHSRYIITANWPYFVVWFVFSKFIFYCICRFLLEKNSFIRLEKENAHAASIHNKASGFTQLNRPFWWSRLPATLSQLVKVYIAWSSFVNIGSRDKIPHSSNWISEEFCFILSLVWTLWWLSLTSEN